MGAAPDANYQQASSSSAGGDGAVEVRDAAPRRKRAAWAACAAALCVAGVAFRGAVSPAVVGGGVSRLDMITGAQRNDWSVYKFTIPVGNASLAPLKALASAIFGPVTVSDLGCGGLKLSAGTTASAGARLHFVQSEILSDDPTPIDVWERYWEALNGDMSDFNAFMHSKATLFTTEFAAVLANVEGLGLPVLRRKSEGYSFNATAHPGWTGAVAHALFPLRGRVYEVVGPVTRAMEASFETSHWPAWAGAECPAAHRLDDDLERYASTFGAYATGHDENSTQYADWARSAGYWPPMLMAVSTAVPGHFLAALESGETKVGRELAALTGEALAVTRAGNCAVAHAATVATYTGFKLPLKYVHNADAPVGRASVDDFDAYVANTHADVAGAYADWAGWDHWLDFHVGLRLGTERDDAADAAAAALNARLDAAAVPVGQRYESGGQVHWYAGFEGGLAVEFCVVPNATDAASVNGLAEICTCRADNNLEQYEADTGRNCTTGAVSL